MSPKQFYEEPKEAKVEWSTEVNGYNVWGLPFFTEQNNKEFHTAFDEEVIADSIPCGPKLTT